MIKDILHPKKSFIKGAVSDTEILFLYVRSLINREDLVEKQWSQYERSKTLKENIRELAFARIYLDLENFILSNKPIVIKRNYTRNSLRAEIKENVEIDSLTPELRLIFADPNQKTIDIYSIFLLRLLEYIGRKIGIKHLFSVIKKSNSNKSMKKLSFYEDNAFDYRSFTKEIVEEAKQKGQLVYFFKNLYHIIFLEVSSLFGQRLAIGLFERLFFTIETTYDREVASMFLQVAPEGILEDKKITYLNRDELEEKIRQRTEELRLEKESVEKKVLERTAELDEERAKLSIVTENMREGVILLDSSNHVIFANEIAKKMLSLEKRSMGDEIFVAFRDKFQSVDIADKIKKCDPQRSIVIPEVSYQNKYFRLSFNCLYGSDSKLSTSIIWLEDISEEKMLEQKKREFISLITHQLRTPLSGLKWTFNMLLKGDLGDLKKDQKVFLMKSYESNERMIGLVDNILGANQSIAAKNSYKFRELQILDLLENILYEIRPAAKSKNISIELENKDKKVPKVYADDQKMRSVLQNLIENAVKYTKSEGLIKIGVDEADGMVRVSIADNGIGIPKQEQNNIFSKFFRAENANGSEVGGSGLGLFIVKSIIEKHKGHIWFESAVDKGTTFYFTLPVSKPDSI